jgi:hypothetical protein
VILQLVLIQTNKSQGRDGLHIKLAIIADDGTRYSIIVVLGEKPGQCSFDNDKVGISFFFTRDNIKHVCKIS